MTTLTPATDHRPAASARGMSWYAPHLADVVDTPRARSAVLLGGAVVCTAVDVALMYPAVARVLRHSVTLSWLTAAGIGVIALLAASWAGWLWRGARGNHPGSRGALVLSAVVLTFWAATGVVVMAMRTSASHVATGVAYEGTAATPQGTSFDTVAGAAFLLVYLLCGILAFSDLYVGRNDAHTARRAAHRELKVARKALVPLEATFQHVRANVRHRGLELEQVDEVARAACRRNASFAAELKQMVRGAMVEGLGDPGTTGIASPRHPDNPAGREDGGRTTTTDGTYTR